MRERHSAHAAFYQQMQEALQRGEHLVLVTVVDSEGAVPRGAGARMLVSRAGRLAGTVGGGLVEYKSILLAQAMLSQAAPDRGSREENFALQQSGPDSLGMVCGGKVRVRLQELQNSPALEASLSEIRTALEQAMPSLLVQDVEAGDNPFRVFYREAAAPDVRDQDKEQVQARDKAAVQRYREQPSRYLLEDLVSPGIVYIFGGGHVAQALVPILTSVFFTCVVLEDREEFLDPSLFPEAKAVQRVDFSAIDLQLTAADYACIMTRGHSYDLVLQEQVLHSPVRYIGVIGSRSKRRYVEEQLRQRGISDADLARVYTPIGVPVGGNTPQEIAISITAQLLQLRNGVPVDEIPRGQVRR